MLQYRKSYKTDHPFKSWIYKIARNVFADHYRKNKRQAVNLEEAQKIGVEAASQHTDLEKAESEKLLYRALATLPDDQREVLVLSRFQELKYEEIAKITNTTVANVKVKVHRSIKKLRDAYFELEQLN